MSDVATARQPSDAAGEADLTAVLAMPPLGMAIAMPGRFEAGGIGPMMM